MELKYIINSNFNVFKDINVPNNDALQNSFDLSSKNDLDIYKINEDNVPNILSSELKTIIKKDRDSLKNPFLNDNQISNFNFFIISKKQISSRNDNNLIKDNYNKKTKRGRKRKREDISNCKRLMINFPMII